MSCHRPIDTGTDMSWFGMMTSSNGNIFRVTGLLWVEFTGHRWIPLTKASDAELWCFLWSAPEPTVEQTMETPVIWDVIALITTSLWWMKYSPLATLEVFILRNNLTLKKRRSKFSIEIPCWISLIIALCEISCQYLIPEAQKYYIPRTKKSHDVISSLIIKTAESWIRIQDFI